MSPHLVNYGSNITPDFTRSSEVSTLKLSAIQLESSPSVSETTNSQAQNSHQNETTTNNATPPFDWTISVKETPAQLLNKNLVSIKVAEADFGFSRVSFWRFRKRHRIHLLPGRRVCIDDILAAFSAERIGRRRVVT